MALQLHTSGFNSQTNILAPAVLVWWPIHGTWIPWDKLTCKTMTAQSPRTHARVGLSMRRSTLTEVAVPSPHSSLCNVHSSIIPSILLSNHQKGLAKNLMSNWGPIASPETSKLISCRHHHATVLPSQAYSPFIMAKLHVNGKANCTPAQRYQKDNSICPTSSGELKPIQATQTSD